MGISTHILKHPRLPTSEIQIRPEQFTFFNRSELDELIGHHVKMRGAKFFPVDLERNDLPDSFKLEDFIDGKRGFGASTKNHRDVIILEKIGKIESILERCHEGLPPRGKPFRFKRNWIVE